MADLFAGCGGLSLGLEQAGFTPWFVNEIMPQYCETYKRNHNLSDNHYLAAPTYSAMIGPATKAEVSAQPLFAPPKVT